jgi:iron(III) transport system substrate-binding protein
MVNMKKGTVRPRVPLLVVLLVFCLVLFARTLAAGQKLTIYSNWPSDQVKVVADAFHEANPSIDVDFFRAPIEELFTIFSMEMKVGSVRADVFFIGDPARAEDWKKQGVLYKYQPPKSVMDGFDQKFIDRDGCWVPVSIVPMVIQYNTKYVSKDKAPKSWADLLNPAYDGKIAYGDPKMTGSVHIPIYQITTMLAGKGKPYGWYYYEQLAKLHPMIVGGHRQLRELVVAGERWIAGEQSMDHVFEPIKKGDPVWFSWPSEGTPATYEVVAIVKNARNLKEAQTFLDWIASTKSNKDVIYGKLGRISVRKDVPFTAPDGKTLDQMDLVPVGTELAPEIRAAQSDKFTELIKKFK